MASTAETHIGRDHYQVKITAGKNSIIGDEPEEAGGKDEGLDPYELLLGALGACTCSTLRMYADRKEWKLEEINVSLSLERDEEKNTTDIKRNIEFIGELSFEEKQRLLDIANKCPIHKILSHSIYITTQSV